MRLLFCCFIFFSFGSTLYSQNVIEQYTIKRSSLGSGGSSKVIKTSKGTYIVSQSIGQSGVIGTSVSKGYYLRQGYQQPSNKIKIVKQNFDNDNLAASVYPNPFEESVSVSFSETIEKEVLVMVFDVSGKHVFSKKFIPSQSIQMQLKDLSSGSYLLKIKSNNKIFNAKLLKK